MKALISGGVGLQINIPVESFPVEYKSVVFMDDKASMDVAGVAYSHCLVLEGLGDKTTFITGLGNDRFADVIQSAISDTGANCMIERQDKESMVSVILYDSTGRRMILREGRKNYSYTMNPGIYENINNGFDVALFSMAGFSRALLPVVKNNGIPVACDFQTTHNLFNEYGKDFMKHSDIIFFSNDHYEGDINKLLDTLYEKYKYHIIGVGMGADGCLLCVNGKTSLYSAVPTEVVNTVGAGDSLFASFIHCLFNGDTPEVSIKKAQVFAAEKIRHKTASQGFMNKDDLIKNYFEIYGCN